jgi:hypothetical protein
MSVAQPASPPTGHGPDNEITIVSHSNLFYWWPVWAVGFLMALLTAIDRHRMVTVPPGSQLAQSEKVVLRNPKGEPETLSGRYVVVLPADGRGKPRGFDEARDTDIRENGPQDARLHMARSKSYGVIFAMALVLVIVITNVPLRGMWSVLVIVGLITLSLIFHLAGWWERREGLRRHRHDRGEAAGGHLPPPHPRAGLGRPDRQDVGGAGPPLRNVQRPVHQQEGTDDRGHDEAEGGRRGGLSRPDAHPPP